MALPIEDQIHKHFVNLEDERCRRIEQENMKDPKKAGKKVERRRIEKPWRRTLPVSLCQQYEYMLFVTDYDYDLSDYDFQKYCEARGVLYVAGDKGSRQWEYLPDHTKSKEDFLNDPYFQYARSSESDDAPHKYSPKEMSIHWEILSVSRARLQDCWEIYCHTRVGRVD